MKTLRMTLLVVGLLTILTGCGVGGGGTNSTTDTKDNKVAHYNYPKINEFSTENIKLASSLEQSEAAMLQAILLINSYIYTDPTKTNFDTFQEKNQKALKAITILEDTIDTTLYWEEMSTSSNSKPSSAVNLGEELISPTPYGGNRPIETIMEKYKVSAQQAMNILEDSVDKIKKDAYNNAASYRKWQKGIEASVQVIKLGGAAVAEGAAVMAAGAATPAVMFVTTAGAFVVMTGEICKTVIDIDHWAAAYTGTEETPMPKLFVPVIDASEIVGVITMENGTDVVIYATDKLADLVKSGGKTISFGKHDIQIRNTVTSLVDLQKNLDLSQYPSMEPGVYITPDGKQIRVPSLPDGFNQIISRLPVEDRLIVVSDGSTIKPPIASPASTEFADSIVVELTSPDGGYIVYRINSGKLDLYTGPITLTETSIIQTYVDMDPYSDDSNHSSVAEYTYTKTGPKNGKWILEDTLIEKYSNEGGSKCYSGSLTLSNGNFTEISSVSKDMQGCNWDESESVTYTGLWTTPPATLIPKHDYPMSIDTSRSNPVTQWGAGGGIGIKTDVAGVKCGYITDAAVRIASIHVGSESSDPSSASWSGSYEAPTPEGYEDENGTSKFQISASTSAGCVRYIYKWDK